MNNLKAKSILPVWADLANDDGYKTPELGEVFGSRAENVKKEFAAFVQDLRDQGKHNIDSFRIAEGLNKEAMELYDTYVTCCGHTDIGRSIDGVLYMFGANYGH